MCNPGSLKDWGQFQNIYADVPGVMAEDIADRYLAGIFSKRAIQHLDRTVVVRVSGPRGGSSRHRHARQPERYSNRRHLVSLAGARGQLLLRA